MTLGETPTQQPSSARLGGEFWPLAVYLLIALAASWPLARSMAVAIPYGCEAEATVPLFNLWTLWWNADRAADAFRGYWNAPIFYPTRGTFAFSEAQPTMVTVAPVVWLTGSRALAYNLYLLAILTLNGWSSWRLMKRVGHRPWLAFCGGVSCELMPFVWWQLGVVQLTTLFGIVWTIHSLLDLFETAKPDSPETDPIDAVRVNDASKAHSANSWWSRVPVGVRLGAAFGLTYWLCNYWGLFLAILLVPTSVCLWNGRLLQMAFWRDVLVAAILAGVMIGPIASIQKTLSAEHTWQRDGELIQSLSAQPRDLTDTPWRPFVPGLEHPDPNRRDQWPLGGGGLKLLLAPVGLLAALATRGRRRWGLFVAALGLIAFGLSLGPNNRLASWLPAGLAGMSPYEGLQRIVPGFALIRSPFRFVVFVQLAAIWLSVEALSLLDPRRWRWRTTPAPLSETMALTWPQRIAGWLRWGPLVVASLIVSLEVLPARQRLHPCAPTRDLPVWVLWLRDNAQPGAAVACLPFPNGYTVKDYEATTDWMYWATFHRLPLINGYSGFFPNSFVQMKSDLGQSHPPAADGQTATQPQLKLYPYNNPGLKALNASGAAYAVVWRSFATRDDVWAHPATKFRWAWVTGDEARQIDIYEIGPPPEE